MSSTKPSNPHDEHADPETQPGKAMLIVRFVICLGLCIGIAVFGFHAVNELAGNQPASVGDLDDDFGTSSGAPRAPQQSTGNAFLDLTQRDQTQFIPIVRAHPNASPHPGTLTPYQNSDPYHYPPYRLPNTGSEVWELCDYGTADGTLDQLIAHYDSQAQRNGLTKLSEHPTTDNTPGGVRAVWSNGADRLEVTAWPVPETNPREAPFRPQHPLRWAVKYIYASSADAP